MCFENAAAIAQPVSAVSIERDEGFAGQVVGAQKRTHNRRGGFPPDRKAEIDRVVVGQRPTRALRASG
ncbi:hypothetical protein J2X66_004853 [Pseudomonas sp. 3296]|nr:hypothetical protein [Pseudomonas sp. 3296]